MAMIQNWIKSKNECAISSSSSNHINNTKGKGVKWKYNPIRIFKTTMRHACCYRDFCVYHLFKPRLAILQVHHCLFIKLQLAATSYNSVSNLHYTLTFSLCVISSRSLRLFPMLTVLHRNTHDYVFIAHVNHSTFVTWWNIY